MPPRLRTIALGYGLSLFLVAVVGIQGLTIWPWFACSCHVEEDNLELTEFCLPLPHKF